MQRIDAWRRRCRIALSVFYGIAGILHVVWPAPFIGITPAWVPDPARIIFLTGLCELAGAIGLFVPALRRPAGIALALYAFCVFPANIKHAVDSLGGAEASPWQWLYHLIRLPLQVPIAWLPLFAAGIVNWPFRRYRRERDKADPSTAGSRR